MGEAAGVRPVALVRRQLGGAEEFAEPLILGVVADRDDHVAVRGLEHAVGNDVRVLVAAPLRHLAGDQVVRSLVDQPGQLGIDQGDIDVLAPTGPVAVPQGRQDRGRRVHSAHDVGDADADLHRFAVGRAGEAHDAAVALRQQVVAGAVRVRSGLAEAGDRAVDESRQLFLRSS